MVSCPMVRRPRRMETQNAIGEGMQVGDLVKHNGSGPVGWKMKDAIGMLVNRIGDFNGGEWQVRWVSNRVSEWDQNVNWFSPELEVISENR